MPPALANDEFSTDLHFNAVKCSGMARGSSAMPAENPLLDDTFLLFRVLAPPPAICRPQARAFPHEIPDNGCVWYAQAFKRDLNL